MFKIRKNSRILPYF